MVALYASVKDTHRLIGTANLYLKEIGFLVVARRADSHGTIHILPGSSSTQNIVDNFPLWEGLHRLRRGYRTRVGAGTAVEMGVGSAPNL